MSSYIFSQSVAQRTGFLHISKTFITLETRELHTTHVEAG